MKLVPRGCVRLVARFEGFRSCPYLDVAGVWTIGYGETLGVHSDTPCISPAKARRLLRRRLRYFAEAVDKLVERKLTRRQRVALISLAYNVGLGNFESSTLLRRLNAGEPRCRVISEEFPRWVVAGGARQQGLVKRRKAEVRYACGR